MKKVQHEKIHVLTPCIKKCKQLLNDGAILEWKRHDETDKYHVDGSPDIEIRFVKDGTLWLLQVECKRPDGKGVHRKKQKVYRDKYDQCYNVVYILVESVEKMTYTLEKLSGFYNTKLNGINVDFT